MKKMIAKQLDETRNWIDEFDQYASLMDEAEFDNAKAVGAVYLLTEATRIAKEAFDALRASTEKNFGGL